MDFKAFSLAVEKKNRTAAQTLVGQLDLFRMKKQNKLITLTSLIDICRPANTSDIARDVIDYWIASCPGGGGICRLILTDLFFYKGCSIQNLHFIKRIFPEFDIKAVIFDSSESVLDDNLKMGLKRIFEVYDDLTLPVLSSIRDTLNQAYQQDLQDNSELDIDFVHGFRGKSGEGGENKDGGGEGDENDNDSVPYILSLLKLEMDNKVKKLTKSTKPAVKPLWVKPGTLTQKELVKHLPLPSQISRLLPDTEDAVKLFQKHCPIDFNNFELGQNSHDNKTQGKGEGEKEEDEVYQGMVVASNYNISTPAEKLMIFGDSLKDFIKKDKYDSKDDDIIFRILGPSNPIYHMGLDGDGDEEQEAKVSNPFCEKYGCRMLTCCCNDRIIADPSDLTDFGLSPDLDWFGGCCIVCSTPLSGRHLAVRRPDVGGGWCGCYCSIKCLASTFDYKLSLILVGRMEKQLMTIGIADRQYK